MSNFIFIIIIIGTNKHTVRKQRPVNFYDTCSEVMMYEHVNTL